MELFLKTLRMLMSIFNKLDGMDAANFWGALDKYDIGMDTVIYHECPFCGNKWEEGLQISEEFFRPRYKA